MTTTANAAPGVDPRPILVCLHWLGGSGRSWDKLASALDPDVRVISVDLPGFGDAAHHPGAPVGAMADHVAAVLRQVHLGRWMLAGHSMGAKVALALARRIEDRALVLGELSHLVLMAGSPPSPEPMDETRRADMLGWFKGSEDQSRAQAQKLIDGNVGEPLDPSTNAQVAADILRLNRDAWEAWLDGGSREDWSATVGLLNTPTLILAGERDGDLGPDGQKTWMTRHFAQGTFAVVPGAGHLLPVERPDHVARLVLAHAGLTGPSLIPGHYRALIESDRVSARVRDLLLKRGMPDDPGRPPQAVSPTQITTLRALVDRVVPQGEPRIDIAARIDEGLATTPGDGWRFDDLPPDQDSYRRGLDTLDRMARSRSGQGFAQLPPAQQDDILADLPDQQGSVEPAIALDLLGPHQMALWFEDLRANAVRVYMSHPLTMARIGYSGIGYGGDAARLPGFDTVGLDQTESWEPKAMEFDR